MSIAAAPDENEDEGGDKGLAAAPLQLLLNRLALEGSPAGEAYESLRRRLHSFFGLELADRAEELTDLTLDRMARKLDEGTAIEKPFAYALGVARLIVFESRHQAARAQRVSELLAASAASDEGPGVEASHAALEACLRKLEIQERDLVMGYYAADGAARIHGRQQLADQHGMSMNALRNRVLRLRERLERCTMERLWWLERNGLLQIDTRD